MGALYHLPDDERAVEGCGDSDSQSDEMQIRVAWLCGSMPDHRLPKCALFGWLPQPGGRQRRWRDLIRRDLTFVRVPEDKWHEANLSRASWHATYSQWLGQCNQQQSCLVQLQGQMQCPKCRQCFRSEGDRVRHTCTTERQKPAWEQ